MVRSTQDEGFVFEHMEGNGNEVIENCKALKNRAAGFYFYNAHHVTVSGGLSADNGIGIYVRR